MPLQIIHQDITKIKCDAIVNPSDCFFSGSGGTDRAIHKAAGIELDRACEKLEKIDFGEVAATRAFNLPSKYIIHTMGPIWEGGDQCEAVLLRSCYVNALMKAKRLGAESVAFPLISAGTFGFPKDKVLRIAIDAISDFLFTVDSELSVYICIIDRNSFELSKGIALQEYLSSSKRFVYEEHAIKMNRVRGYSSDSILRKEVEEEEDMCADVEMALSAPEPICASTPKPTEGKPKQSTKQISLAEWIKLQDDTFPVLLLKLIDKKGMSEVECYKRANVSKQTFWKIVNDPKYSPSRITVILFAVALRLDLEETEALLKTIGASLSHSSTFDLIIEYYISIGCYDTCEIDAALFQYDQKCLWSEL